MGEFVVSAIWPYHNSLILLYSVTLEEYVMRPILLLTADNSSTFTATVVISGILIVVGVLLLLIGVFALFGKIVPIIEKKTKVMEEKAAARKAARKARRAAKKAAREALKNGNTESIDNNLSVAPTEVLQKPASQPIPIVEQGISGEVVAAITAAVVATEGQSAVIRSIKKKNVGGRNPWSHAATIDNTRPF